MKLIHLSDLHIGKRVNEISMLADQEYILSEMIGMIDGEKPHAVLIAGDVYDKSVPTAEAVSLFDDFLCRLAERCIPVFIISGNHDSAERLSFGARLMETAGIHISPVYRGSVKPITLSDEYGPVHFWLLPFLKPVHVRRFFPETVVESYTDACRAAVEEMHIDTGERNVLLTHQFVTGALTCESEEIIVGGTDNVDASVFSDFDYVALGHIHGPQNVGSNRVRYCGTPLKYSFSEVGHYKSMSVVELGEKGELHLRTLPLTPLHDLRVLRGSFAGLMERDFDRGDHDDYLHIILTDEEDIPEATGRLRQLYPNLMKLSYDNTRTRSDQTVGAAEEVERKSPLELFAELYEKQNNQPMSEEQLRYMQCLLEELGEEQV
ncbi:MAG: exonuclease SbcCD subunit D [Ruminococcaceae bacterium]|nr:exonuclease SbcCD subunit D [Oscillospiraceae bacterium]